MTINSIKVKGKKELLIKIGFVAGTTIGNKQMLCLEFTING